MVLCLYFFFIPSFQFLIAKESIVIVPGKREVSWSADGAETKHPAVTPSLSSSVSEDSTDVGEEDSFLGQTSVHTSPPQTFSYFSQVSSSDPFGSIGQSPLSTAAAPTGLSAFSKPPASLPLPPGAQDALNAFPPSAPKAQYGAPPPAQMAGNAYLPSQPSTLPPCTFGSPPQGTPPQGYNPYRHTPLSSRANPYITPPQLQQGPPPAAATPPVPVQYPGPPESLPPPQVGPPLWAPLVLP